MLCWTFLMSFNTLTTDTTWSVHCGVSSDLTYRFRLRPTDPDWDLQIQTETYRFRPNGQFIVEWAVTYRSILRPTHSYWMVSSLRSEQWPTDSNWDLHIQTEHPSSTHQKHERDSLPKTARAQGQGTVWRWWGSWQELERIAMFTCSTGLQAWRWCAKRVLPRLCCW